MSEREDLDAEQRALDAAERSLADRERAVLAGDADVDVLADLAAERDVLADRRQAMADRERSAESRKRAARTASRRRQLPRRRPSRPGRRSGRSRSCGGRTSACRPGWRRGALIGQAIGIVMARHEVAADRAFQLLLAVSRCRDVEMRDVAALVIENHDLPD